MEIWKNSFFIYIIFTKIVIIINYIFLKSQIRQYTLFSQMKQTQDEIIMVRH